MRTINALSLVSLPKVDVVGALALGAMLITIAERDAELPPAVVPALQTMKKKHRALERASAKRHALSGVDPTRARETDRRLDTAYRSLDAHLGAFELVEPNVAEAAGAAAVRAAIFPDGLKFTQLPFVQQWGASQLRLHAIHRGGLAPIIERTGGGPILREIERAHAEYGQVLGITEPTEQVDAPLVRDPLDELSTAMRDYIVAVVASARGGDDAAQARVDRLLRPIMDWRTRRSGDGQVAPPDPGPTPSPEPAPAPSPEPVPLPPAPAGPVARS